MSQETQKSSSPEMRGQSESQAALDQLKAFLAPEYPEHRLEISLDGTLRIFNSKNDPIRELRVQETPHGIEVHEVIAGTAVFSLLTASFRNYIRDALSSEL